MNIFLKINACVFVVSVQVCHSSRQAAYAGRPPVRGGTWCILPHFGPCFRADDKYIHPTVHCCKLHWNLLILNTSKIFNTLYCFYLIWLDFCQQKEQWVCSVWWDVWCHYSLIDHGEPWSKYHQVSYVNLTKLLYLKIIFSCHNICIFDSISVVVCLTWMSYGEVEPYHQMSSQPTCPNSLSIIFILV